MAYKTIKTIQNDKGNDKKAILCSLLILLYHFYLYKLVKVGIF